MTFVILSRRSLATSTARTISLDFFVGLAALVVVVAAGLGLFIGSSLRGNGSAAVDAVRAGDDDGPHPAALIERIGELSARMVQLELEAGGLAQRLEAVKEFGQRMEMLQSPPLGPVARTPPAPSGGPLLKPQGPGAADGATPKTALPAAKTAPQLPEGIRHLPLDNVPPGNTPDMPNAAPGHNPAGPHAALRGIEENIAQLAQLFSSLDRHASEVSLAHMSFPGRAPVAKSIRVSGFGNRIDPFRKKAAFHSGIDFAGPSGTAIQASAGGRVIFSGVRKDYGKTVEIDHGAGLVTRYAHLSELIAEKDQVVMPGQVIAKMGSTGRSTGSHLHFEIIKDGRFVDPSVYLRRF